MQIGRNILNQCKIVCGYFRFLHCSVGKHGIPGFPAEECFCSCYRVIFKQIQVFPVDHNIGHSVFSADSVKIAQSIHRNRRNHRFLNIIGQTGNLEESAVLVRIQPCGHFQCIHDVRSADLHDADAPAVWKYLCHIFIADASYRQACTDFLGFHQCHICPGGSTVCIRTKISQVGFLFIDGAVSVHVGSLQAAGCGCECSGKLCIVAGFQCFYSILCGNVPEIIAADHGRGYGFISGYHQLPDMTQAGTGTGNQYGISVLICHFFAYRRAMGSALNKGIDPGSVLYDGSRAVRACSQSGIRIRQMPYGDDVIRTAFLCLIHGSLYLIIQILSVVSAAEAVRRTSAFLEIGSGF